ncbi:hypothetical protein MJO28_012930 [Puccinia striiformis f. sp. tritici]|uniref:Uncharacterized protein n=1 Tax=Puccinia striiformis f. sp. tritici TaxID=168172 RepID=A0ACC0DY41_9BASI|nr:hypothetical protein Pst134EB_025249 [Puccinia striiformis f. sp. tritici]KAI7940645.1 hypothetical protein MJO28_012930 [Puccinia striiformis f. sp. tritici]KAI9629863.1 hypothetical protein KEM48_012497 [Puccinia striiformis f. sp. tritici PST-130]
MIFRLLVPLALAIGTIAMEFPEIDASAEISQSLLAASNPSSNKPASIPLGTVADTQKADLVRENINQEDILGHWIPITSESTATQGQIQSSQEEAVNRFESTSETGHRIRRPYNQEGRATHELEQTQENPADKFTALNLGSEALRLFVVWLLFYMLATACGSAITASRHL